MSQQPSRVTPELVQPTAKGRAVAQPAAGDDRDDISSLEAGPPLRQGKVSLNFRLDPVMHQQLRSLSHRTDISIQHHVETAVRRYLATMVP